MISSNISNSYRINNYRPNFGSSLDDERDEFALKNREYLRKNIGQPAYNSGLRDGRLLGVLLGIIASMITGIGIQSCQDKNDTKAKTELMNKFSEFVNNKDIQQDTFSVRDVNDDEVPDIILYKKDGSEIVLDVKNNKILNSKTIVSKEYVNAE